MRIVFLATNKPGKRSIGGLFYRLGCGEGNPKVLLLRRRRHFFSASKDGNGANSVRLKLSENQEKKRIRMHTFHWNGSFHTVRLSVCN